MTTRVLLNRWAREGELPPSPAPHPQNQTPAVYTEELTHLAAPGFAVEVTEADGTVEGYLHPLVCREKWEGQHPGFNYNHASAS